MRIYGGSFFPSEEQVSDANYEKLHITIVINSLLFRK